MNPKKTVILSNSSLFCELSPAGASLLALRLISGPCAGRELAVSLAPECYPFDPSYAGATLGPSCGRIRGGYVIIDGQGYNLTRNDGNHTLHGGPAGLSHQTFHTACTEECTHDTTRAVFSITLADGLDGWPGERRYTVTYTVGPGCMLTVSYEAEASKAAYLDCSNHIYWNLDENGHTNALNHKLRIDADKVIFNDCEHVASSVEEVCDTPFDFRTLKTISAGVKSYAFHPQLMIGKGYNNAFILNTQRSAAAELESSDHRVRMKLYTDQPCIIFYSGGFLSGSALADGTELTPSCGLALEAQGWFPMAGSSESTRNYFLPGEKFTRFIRYEFET